VLYYGDEIGMGDNIYLGDRNGVRTPMQWSADRNAGFSRANPQRLYLPVIIDPEYHYEALNVEAQQRNLHLLLLWMKRLILLRKRFRAFGRGSIEFLYPGNKRVLVFIRRLDDEILLVVANLSRFVQFSFLSGASTMRSSWWWPTSHGLSNLQSWICPLLKAWYPRNCLVRRISPPSADCLIFSP
jgi:maltose alpha-D-glucosyltransferase/alpha-amylase